jgi:hypothetical protein
MIARHRHVVGKHRVRPRRTALLPTTAGHFVDTPPEESAGNWFCPCGDLADRAPVHAEASNVNA